MTEFCDLPSNGDLLLAFNRSVSPKVPKAPAVTSAWRRLMGRGLRVIMIPLLSENIRDHFPVNVCESEIPSRVTICQFLMIDTHEVEQRRM